jgi:hypothetical protein
MIIPNDLITRLTVGQIDLHLEPAADARPPYRCGATVAVQPAHNRPARCRAQIVRVTDVALRDLDDQHAKRLGHRDLERLMLAWVDEHGLWNENARAWLVQIVVDRSEAPRLLMPEVGRALGYAKPASRGQLDREHDPANRGYGQDDHRAMRDEPEAVDDNWLARFAQRERLDKRPQRSRDELRELRDLPLHERVRRLEEQARERHDLRDTLRYLRMKVADAEKQALRAERRPGRFAA